MNNHQNELDTRSDLKSKIFDLSGNEERGFGKPYGAIDYYIKKTWSNNNTDTNTKYNL